MFRNALRMGASSMLIRVPQMMQLKLPHATIEPSCGDLARISGKPD